MLHLSSSENNQIFINIILSYKLSLLHRDTIQTLGVKDLISDILVGIEIFVCLNKRLK